jgi:hypothetical protein
LTARSVRPPRWYAESQSVHAIRTGAKATSSFASAVWHQYLLSPATARPRPECSATHPSTSP